MNSGLIGNCQYAALIAANGGVDWLCWPRFDSSFIFGGLVDSTKGGIFSIQPESPSEGEQRYLDNTNVLRTVFKPVDGEFEILDFAPRFRQFDRSYRPTMLIRMVRPLSGTPRIRVACRPRYDYGAVELSPRYGSNHIEFAGAPQPVRLTTDASISYVAGETPFVLTRPLYFVLTWGAPLEAPLAETCIQFYDRTMQYWRRWVKHCHLPSEYQAEVVRSALVLKLHQFEDTGAIIASTTTSLPEAPGSQRNWDYRYCWLRDAYFTVGALDRLSHFEELEAFENYLRNLVTSRQGGLQPVYGIAGETDLEERIEANLAGFHGNQPVRIGNDAYRQRQYDVYGEMILSMAPLFTDIRFRDQQPDLAVLRSLVQDIESALGLADAGLWEYRGKLQMHSFTQLMHWAGARCAAEIATRFGEKDLAAKATGIVERSTSLLLTRCRDSQTGLYLQGEGIQAWDASLLMFINLGFLDIDDEVALRLCAHLDSQLSTGNGLMRRYIHADDFGEPSTAFVLCSFWLAEAYARLGKKDEARRRIDAVLQCSNRLGLLSEDIDPVTGMLWGNFPQTYSHVGLINAAFALGSP